MFERKNKSVSADRDPRPSQRFFFAKSQSSDESFDKDTKESLNKRINESLGKNIGGKGSRCKGGKKKSRDGGGHRLEKDEDLSVDNDLLWIGKENKKKERKKKEKSVGLTDEQLLDYAVKEKLQEIFLFLFFLIVTNIAVLLAAPSSAGDFARTVSRAFMDNPFMNLANETEIPFDNFEQHHVEIDEPNDDTRRMSGTEDKNKVKPPIPALMRRWQRRFGSSTSSWDRALRKDSLKKPENSKSSPKNSYNIDFLNDDEDNSDENMDTDRVENLVPPITSFDGYDWRGFLADTKDLFNFKTLRESTSLEDFWDFLETTFINVLYWDHWYSNEDPVHETFGEDKQLLFSSQLIGVPRIKQVKVRSDSCSINPSVQHYFNTCLTYYSSSVEDFSNIRPKNSLKFTQPAWVYAPASETKDWGSSSGKFSSYGRGGFYFDFDPDKGRTKRIIEELKENQWVTRATRAVILDFAFYNANVNLFLLCKIIFEMPPTGGMHPTAFFEPLKFYRYIETVDYVVLGGEGVFILFIIFLTLHFVKKIASKGLRYLKHFGTVLNIIIILLGWASIAMGLYRYFAVERDVSDLIRINYNTHPNFSFVRFIQIDFNLRSAILLFFVWMRGILYLKYCAWILPLFRTIGDSENRNALLGLSVLFFCILFGLAELGYLIFGEQSKQFHSLESSMATLFSAVIGQFDYLDLERINATLAGIYFSLFIFLIFFILLMLFAAVIAHAYTMARTSVPPVKDRMVSSYLSCILSCGMRGRESEDDLTIEKMRLGLSRAGYTELEIAMFYSKFGVEAGTELTDEKKRELVEKLRKRKFEFDNDTVSPQDVATMMDDICRLKQKVAELTKQVNKSRRQVLNITKSANISTKEALANLEAKGLGLDKSIVSHDLI